MGDGAWISEAPLWIKWLHCGQLCAITECSLTRLCCVDFQNAVYSWGGPLHGCLQKFAIFFLGELERFVETNENMTDLPMPSDLLTDLAQRAMQLQSMKSGSSAFASVARSVQPRKSSGVRGPSTSHQYGTASSQWL